MSQGTVDAAEYKHMLSLDTKEPLQGMAVAAAAKSGFLHSLAWQMQTQQSCKPVWTRYEQHCPLQYKSAWPGLHISSCTHPMHAAPESLASDTVLIDVMLACACHRSLSLQLLPRADMRLSLARPTQTQQSCKPILTRYEKCCYRQPLSA